MIDLRQKAIQGLIEEIANDNLGVYPKSVSGNGDKDYGERSEWMEGWNAYAAAQANYCVRVEEWLRELPKESSTLVHDLLLDDILGININDSNISMYINVSDVFYWGCADCEKITLQELPELLECYELSPKHGGELWVARKRGERPQGALYQYIPEEEHTLFDACGPYRKAQPGNPVDHV